MNRERIEYGKASLWTVLTLLTGVIIFVGGASPAYLVLPVVFLLLAGVSIWRADAFSKGQ